jgi:hypothetical protein
MRQIMAGFVVLQSAEIGSYRTPPSREPTTLSRETDDEGSATRISAHR